MKTNVCLLHIAQTCGRSVATLILMGQMIDVLVSVGSCNFYLCSCEMSLVP